MRRRRVLATAGTVLATSLGGCLDVFDLGGSDSSTREDVEDVTSRFYRAAANGDFDVANSLVHPNALDDGFSEAEAARLQRANVIVHDVAYHVTEFRSGPNNFIPIVDMECYADSPDPFRYEFAIKLRRHDGAPRIYSGESEDFDRPGPPQVEWDVTDRSGDGHKRWVELRNAGEFPVLESELHVHAGEASYNLFQHELIEPSDVIRLTFADDTSPMPAGTQIKLHWQPTPVTDRSETPVRTVFTTSLSTRSPGFVGASVVR